MNHGSTKSIRVVTQLKWWCEC